MLEGSLRATGGSHPVWTPGGTPAGVLRAMAAEGLLVELLPQVWVAADLVGDPGARAAAVGVLLRGAEAGVVRGGPGPGGGVVGLAAAAWLHGCPTAPARVDLLVARGTGSRDVPPPVRLRRVAAPAARSVRLGPLRVSDRARTLEDLRRLGRGRRDADALRWLEARPAEADGDGGAAPAGAGDQAPARSGARPQAGDGVPEASSRRPVER